MSSDKDRKRKAKRDQKIRERHEEEQRLQRREKSMHYRSLAAEAFRSGDYRRALDHILKDLKIYPSDLKALHFALDCTGARASECAPRGFAPILIRSLRMAGAKQGTSPCDLGGISGVRSTPCINKNHLWTPPSRRLLELFFCASQPGKSLSAFSCDECFQAESHQSGFFLNTRHPRCLVDQVVFDIYCRSHDATSSSCMHEHDIVMPLLSGYN